jgi:hypothetical protein
MLDGTKANICFSMWVFTLLAMESIQTYKTNPHFVVGTVHIPTWTTPLIMSMVVRALVPGTSLLGHLCGIAIGYVGKSHSHGHGRKDADS